MWTSPGCHGEPPREDEMPLEPGHAAPAFVLPDQDGKPVRLSDFKGKRVVVFFYPKASTPG
jgi:peroxiredoxin Q/BCP